MNIYKAEFNAVQPVGHCLIIAAESNKQARKLAEETVGHSPILSVKKVNIQKPCVVEYLSGDY